MKKRISVLLCKAVIALLILLLPSVEKEQAGVSLVFFGWLNSVLTGGEYFSPNHLKI